MRRDHGRTDKQVELVSYRFTMHNLLRFELAESKAVDTHFGPDRDNFMVSKFTPTDEAFEHRAPYW
jgi:hypothetical protein